MTAINLFVEPQRACLLTDAAIIGPDGRVQSIATKVIASAELKCAMACTGAYDGEIWHSLKEAVESCRSQHELMRCLPLFAMKASGEIATALNRSSYVLPSEANLRIIVAIWSAERDEAQGYVFGATIEDLPSGMQAGRPNGCRLYIQPEVPAKYLPSSPLKRDAALRLLTAQRKGRDSIGRHTVGGGAELTIVDRRGVEVSQIHQWPDLVGKQIRPKRGWRFW
jgi:hypothetical protein